MKNKMKPRHNSRTWLNSSCSSSTGSIVCFSGLSNFTEVGSDEPARSRFVEIADCHTKVRIHQSRLDTLEEFSSKIGILIDELVKYKRTLSVEMSEIVE